MILSILIPSIPQRSQRLSQLLLHLAAQKTDLTRFHPTLGQVEFIVDEGDSYLNGGLSIGKKREKLVKKAQGKYLCFLDDDEAIAPNYLESLVRLCQQDADVVTFRCFCKTDYYWTLIDMQLNQENEEATPERIVKRSAWHVCPVKSAYAKMYDFEDSNYAEDWTWMEKVLKHCQTEAHTDAILHSYVHSAQTSEADKIIKAGYV